MSDKPVFSVIIPLYNGARYITTALDCVRAQTFQDLEVVICDDGSTDNSAQVVKDFMREHPQLRIKYVFQKNRGLGGARNTSIRNASGKYLALLDQDDIWYPNKLRSVYDLFNKDPGLDFVCHNEAIRQNGALAGTAAYGPIGSDFFRQLLFDRNCLSTSASTFKKSLIDRAGYFSEDREQIHFVEDYDLWLRMAAARAKFHIIEQALGEYVLHSQNHSSNSLELMYRHEIFVVKKNWKGLEPKLPDDYEKYKLRVAKILISQAYHLKKPVYFYQAVATCPRILIVLMRRCWSKVIL